MARVHRVRALLPALALSVGLFFLGACGAAEPLELPPGFPGEEVEFSFILSADMREFTGDNPDYFRGACEAIAADPGDFMLSAGDIDPPQAVLDTIHAYIGAGYPWYPVTGNHETETPADMDWLRFAYTGGTAPPAPVNTGPVGAEETCYSFDHGSAHFVVLNEYYNGSSDTGTDGDVTDALFAWLSADLKANTKPIVFVAGHEPAFPQPDQDTGRLRHATDSLNKYTTNRDRFWSLLKDKGVTAYLCGHTHNYSRVKIDGLWQLDAGHARGKGDPGAPSTFVKLWIGQSGRIYYAAFRMDRHGRYAPTEWGAF